MEHSPYKLIAALLRLEKQMALYPDAHNAITTALEDLFALVRDYLVAQKQLVLFCFKGNLRIGSEILDGNQKQIKEFSLFLSTKGVISLALDKSVTQEGLLDLFRNLRQVPAKRYLIHHPEIDEAINRIPGIAVRALDLSAVQFSQSTASFGALDATIISEEDLLWHQLLLGDSEVQVPEVVVTNYKKMLNTQNENPLQEERIRQHQGLFHAVGTLFKDFDTTLQQDMLQETIRHLTDIESEQETETLVQSLPSDMVLSMLQKAREAGQEISPALIKLMGALHRAWNQTENVNSSQDKASIMKAEHFDKLIEREYYEQYVLEDYSQDLQHLAQGLRSADQVDKRWLQEVHTEFTEEKLSKRLFGGFTALVIGNYQSGMSIETGEVMVSILEEALEKENMDVVAEFAQAYENAGHGVKDVKLQPIYARINSYLKQQTTIKRIENLFKSENKSPADNIYLEKAIQSQLMLHLPWLTSLYIERNRTPIGQNALRLMLTQRQLTGDYIVKCLLQDSHHNQGSYFNILRLCEEQVSNTQMFLLLKSQHPTIQLQAIKRLIKTNAPQALETLNLLLSDGNLRIKMRALEIVGQFKITQAVPAVIKLLPKAYIGRDAYFLALKSVNVLNRLSDNEIAKKALERLKRKWWTLSPKRLKKIKDAIQ